MIDTPGVVWCVLSDSHDYQKQVMWTLHLKWRGHCECLMVLLLFLMPQLEWKLVHQEDMTNSTTDY